MAKTNRARRTLAHRDGGLVVTFVNTASAKRAPIDTYDELVAWGESCRTLTADEARRLERRGAERPLAAAAVVRRAHALRDLIERILVRLADRQDPDDAELNELNDAIAHTLALRRLVRVAGGFQWGWADPGDDFDRMLWPVASTLGSLLAGGFRHRVGRCAGEDCDLFFVDRAGGSPRKWCDIEVCGRPVRARKYYEGKVKPRRIARKARLAAERARGPRSTPPPKAGGPEDPGSRAQTPSVDALEPPEPSNEA